MYHYFHNVGKSQPTSVETLFDPRHLILYGTVYHEGTHLLSGRSCVSFYFFNVVSSAGHSRSQMAALFLGGTILWHVFWFLPLKRLL